MKLNRDKTIDKYYKILNKNPKKARELIKKLNYKKDHYLLFCIANSYWKEERLRLAERFVTKAFKINPDCSFVLWLLGMVKWDYGQYEAAIYSFEDLVNLGEQKIIDEGCTADIDVAKAQINDSKFQLYRLHKKTNQSLAKKYMTQFIRGLNQGIFTIMPERYLLEENIVLDNVPKDLLRGK